MAGEVMTLDQARGIVRQQASDHPDIIGKDGSVFHWNDASGNYERAGKQPTTQGVQNYPGGYTPPAAGSIPDISAGTFGTNTGGGAGSADLFPSGFDPNNVIPPSKSYPFYRYLETDQFGTSTTRALTQGELNALQLNGTSTVPTQFDTGPGNLAVSQGNLAVSQGNLAQRIKEANDAAAQYQQTFGQNQITSNRTELGNRASTGLSLGDLLLNMAQRSDKLTNDPGNFPAYLQSLQGNTGAGPALQNLVGNGLTITPDQNNYLNDPRFKSVLDSLFTRAAAPSSAAVDQTQQAYNTDPAAAQRFFSQDPEALKRMFGTPMADGGEMTTHGPMSLVDLTTGRSVALMGEGGAPEHLKITPMRKFAAGGDVNAQPDPNAGLRMLASAGLDNPMKVQQALQASQQQPQATGGGGGGGSPLRDAITQYGQTPLARHAMLLAGSGLEGTVGGAAGDQGMAIGPYQIRTDQHPQISAADAADPFKATSFMSNDYNLAAERVMREHPGLWESDPAQASALTAFYAERPTQMYDAARYRSIYDQNVRGFATGGDITVNPLPGENVASIFDKQQKNVQQMPGEQVTPTPTSAVNPSPISIRPQQAAAPQPDSPAMGTLRDILAHNGGTLPQSFYDWTQTSAPPAANGAATGPTVSASQGTAIALGKAIQGVGRNQFPADVLQTLLAGGLPRPGDVPDWVLNTLPPSLRDLYASLVTSRLGSTGAGDYAFTQGLYEPKGFVGAGGIVH